MNDLEKVFQGKAWFLTPQGFRDSSSLFFPTSNFHGDLGPFFYPCPYKELAKKLSLATYSSDLLNEFLKKLETAPPLSSGEIQNLVTQLESLEDCSHVSWVPNSKGVIRRKEELYYPNVEEEEEEKDIILNSSFSKDLATKLKLEKLSSFRFASQSEGLEEFDIVISFSFFGKKKSKTKNNS